MLSSQQLDTLEGLVSNYDDYVVYYAADYTDYSYGDVRDYRIVVYVGGCFSYSDSVFTFSEDLQVFEILENKYISCIQSPDSFSVPSGHLVYTNVTSEYPQICFWETKLNNFDFSKWFGLLVIVLVAVLFLQRLLFGGRS